MCSFRLPGIADLKVADLYLIINFFFVFASLIEFALVSYEPPVKSMAKNWLMSTREKLRTKANDNSTSETAAIPSKTPSALSKLLPDLKKLESVKKDLPDSKSNCEDKNKTVAEVKSYPTTNGVAATGVVTLPEVREEGPMHYQPVGTGRSKGSPQSLRQAVLRRERRLQNKELESTSDYSDTDNTSVPSRKKSTTIKFSPNIDKQESHSMTNKAMMESPTSTSPLLPVTVTLGNVPAPLHARKCDMSNVFTGEVGDEFLEIVDFKNSPDFKRDLYCNSNAFKQRRPGSLTTSNNSQRITENAAVFNMQSRPLDTVIKLEKLQQQPPVNKNSFTKKLRALVSIHFDLEILSQACKLFQAERSEERNERKKFFRERCERELHLCGAEEVPAVLLSGFRVLPVGPVLEGQRRQCLQMAVSRHFRPLERALLLHYPHSGWQTPHLVLLNTTHHLSSQIHIILLVILLSECFQKIFL